MIDYIREQLGDEELLAQLAEEAIELAHAALKLRRTYILTNPTPVRTVDAIDNLVEEIADVSLVLDVLNLDPLTEMEIDIIKAKKMERWAYRLKNRPQSEGIFFPESDPDRGKEAMK